MQGSKTPSGPAVGGGGSGEHVMATGRLPVQSKLASEARPAVTPGPGAARIPVRRKSQPSKLGNDQASPTAAKPVGSPLGGDSPMSEQPATE